MLQAQRFAYAAYREWKGRPIADLHVQLRMLQRGPSKQPFVHLKVFELVARRPTDLLGVQKTWKGLFI